MTGERAGQRLRLNPTELARYRRVSKNASFTQFRSGPPVK